MLNQEIGGGQGPNTGGQNGVNPLTEQSQQAKHHQTPEASKGKSDMINEQANPPIQ